jgi:hypothetical protein
MREIEKKGFKDVIKKVVDAASSAEKKFHGNLGRGALDAADKAGSKLPKSLSPEEYSQADMDKAMNIWKNQGMGKIGNQPTGKPYSQGGDMGKYEFFGQFNPKKNTKGDYVNKPSEDGGIVHDPYTAMKYTAYAKKWGNGIPKDNLVMRREPPSKGEIAAGRAISTGSALGYGAAKAHSYWTDKKNEQKK